MILAALGIPYYGIREVAKIKHDKIKLNKLFSELILLHLLITAILLIVYLIMIFYVSKLELNKPLFFIGCGVLFLNVFPVEWLFQGLEEFKFITIRTLIIRILIIVLLFLIIKSPKDAVLLYLLNFTAVFLNAVINFSYAHKFVRLSFKQLNFKKHLVPLFNILASNLAMNAYVLIDILILGFLSDDKSVGLYTSSCRINRMVLACVTALGFVLIPQVSAAFNNNDHDRMKKLINKSLAYVTLMSIPIGVGIFLLAPELLNLLAGNKYNAAIPTIRILTPIIFLISLSNIFGIQVLTPVGKEKYLVYCVVVGMLVCIVGNFILIPICQYNGTAISSIITETVVVLLTYNFARKFIGFSFSLIDVLYKILSCAIFIPIYILAKMITSSDIIIILLTLFFSTVSYFSIQYYIFKNEFCRDILNDILTKINDSSLSHKIKNRLG